MGMGRWISQVTLVAIVAMLLAQLTNVDSGIAQLIDRFQEKRKRKTDQRTTRSIETDKRSELKVDLSENKKTVGQDAAQRTNGNERKQKKATPNEGRSQDTPLRKEKRKASGLEMMKKKSADKERKGKKEPQEDIVTTLQGYIKEQGVQVAQSGITAYSSNENRERQECVGGLQEAEEVDI